MDTYVNIENSGFSTEEFNDIKLCLETLLSIQAGTQPLDRDLGIDTEGILDYPFSVAQNKLAVEIVEKIEKYEPRVKVKSVTFEGSSDGRLAPRIHIIRAEEE
ncbi:MAG: GPW/gp25 family protein [Lachnospiraceae bacterium]|nr:GPW/gp25 family protein [Lachnospiraceae bacterium]